MTLMSDEPNIYQELQETIEALLANPQLLKEFLFVLFIEPWKNIHKELDNLSTGEVCALLVGPISIVTMFLTIGVAHLLW